MGVHVTVLPSSTSSEKAAPLAQVSTQLRCRRDRLATHRAHASTSTSCLRTRHSRTQQTLESLQVRNVEPVLVNAGQTLKFKHKHQLSLQMTMLMTPSICITLTQFQALQPVLLAAALTAGHTKPSSPFSVPTRLGFQRRPTASHCLIYSP